MSHFTDQNRVLPRFGSVSNHLRRAGISVSTSTFSFDHLYRKDLTVSSQLG